MIIGRIPGATRVLGKSQGAPVLVRIIGVAHPPLMVDVGKAP